MDIDVTISFDYSLAQWKARCSIPNKVVMNAEEHPEIMESIGGSLDHIMLITKEFFANKKTTDGESVDIVFRFAPNPGERSSEKNKGVGKMNVDLGKTREINRHTRVFPNHSEAGRNLTEQDGFIQSPLQSDSMRSAGVTKAPDVTEDDDVSPFDDPELIENAEEESLRRAESITESLCGILPTRSSYEEEKGTDEILLNDPKSFICSVDDTCVCGECGTMLTVYNVIAKPAYVKVDGKTAFYVKLVAYCPLCGREIYIPEIDLYNKQESYSAECRVPAKD